MLVPTQQRWEEVAASRKKVERFLLVIIHEQKWSLVKALVPCALRQCTVASPSSLLLLLQCTLLKVQLEKQEVTLS